jgi:magnesium transporter
MSTANKHVHHSAARHRSKETPPQGAPVYSVFDYNADSLDERHRIDEAACRQFQMNGRITWINVDGLNPVEVEKLCAHYGIHPLIVEDILSRNERPKMEESGDVIFSVLPMMFFNKTSGEVELEQVSILLGKDFVISFQEEPSRDVFDSLRRHLRDPASKLRNRSADYLMYSLLDVIVDSYFGVLEHLADRLEALEDTLIKKQTAEQLTGISALRRDVSTLRRALLPVRELVAHFVRSDSGLLDNRNEKYYRDVLDHTIQATDFMENHRDMLMNLQDLYMNQINLRMNEVMKVFTMVATLLAPATVIGGIFGMNFDVIPLAHQGMGFWFAVGAMLIIPAGMVLWFKRRGWF